MSSRSFLLQECGKKRWSRKNAIRFLEVVCTYTLLYNEMTTSRCIVWARFLTSECKEIAEREKHWRYGRNPFDIPYWREYPFSWPMQYFKCHPSKEKRLTKHRCRQWRRPLGKVCDVTTDTLTWRRKSSNTSVQFPHLHTTWRGRRRRVLLWR